MIFDDVKVGDQFRESLSRRLITISELTEKGAKYTCDPYGIKLGYSFFEGTDGLKHSVPEFGTVDGGEVLFKSLDHPPELWDLLYEKVPVVSEVPIDSGFNAALGHLPDDERRKAAQELYDLCKKITPKGATPLYWHLIGVIGNHVGK